MSLNWKEIDLILEELDLPGAYIQKIVQPDFQTLVFNIFHPSSGRFPLLISLEPSGSRLHSAVMGKIEKKQIKLQRFAQFLRSRIQGGRVLECSQLGSERIIVMKIRRAEEITFLYTRLWGGAGNVIATNINGIILDALFRRPSKKEVSGQEFIPFNPSPQQAAYDSKKKTYEIRQRAENISFNRQIEEAYSSRDRNVDLDKLLQTAEKVFQNQMQKLNLSLSNLRERLKNSEQFEQYKRTADLLATNAHTIKQGREWVDVIDYATNETLKISIKPELTPGENIESYYKQYRKNRGATENLKEEIQNTQLQLAKLEQKRDLLMQTDNSDVEQNISRLKHFIDASSQLASPNQDVKDKTPGLQFQSGPFTIFVGRTAKENDQLLRKYTRGNDYWLHTRDYPGGYVFIKTQRGKTIPLEILLDAGNLALYYSKGRNGGKGELFYTQVKYLRRAKHGQLGLVIPTQEKNLSIILDQKRLDRLFTHSDSGNEQ
ncbi:MAG: fibronectin-binding domain-containing protein [Bacteroidetes bacterium]|nr:fibronectin-binding domain-containing protein [Bacteroidota bacterium]